MPHDDSQQRVPEEPRRTPTGATWVPGAGWDRIPRGMEARRFGLEAERQYLSETPQIGDDAWRWSWERIERYYATVDRARAAFVRGYMEEEERKRQRELSRAEHGTAQHKAERFFSTFLAPSITNRGSG